MKGVSRSVRVELLSVLVAAGLEPAPPKPESPREGDLWCDERGQVFVWSLARWNRSDTMFTERARDPSGYEGWEREQCGIGGFFR